MMFNINDLAFNGYPPMLSTQAELIPVVDAVKRLEVPAPLAKKSLGVDSSTYSSWLLGRRVPERVSQLLLGWLAWWYIQHVERWYASSKSDAAVLAFTQRKRLQLHPHWRKRIASLIEEARQLLVLHDAQACTFSANNYQQAIDALLKQDAISKGTHQLLSGILGNDPVQRGDLMREILLGERTLA